MRRLVVTPQLLSLLLLAAVAIACGDADDGASSSGGAGGTATTSNGGGGTVSSGGAGSVGGGSSTGGSAGSGGSGGEMGALIYQSDFDGDAGSWPAPWQEAGGVLVADVVAGEARLVPVLSNYSLARMTLAGSEVDSESTYGFRFTDVSRQGIGFYVRANGGYLKETQPTGQGYALFIEGFSMQPGIGVWHEEDGEEKPITAVPFSLQNDVPYRARFRVTQIDPAHTRLQGRLWQDGQPEPSTWQLDHTDDQPHVQGINGGFALDAWSTNNMQPAPDLFIDDLEIRQL